MELTGAITWFNSHVQLDYAAMDIRLYLFFLIIILKLGNLSVMRGV